MTGCRISWAKSQSLKLFRCKGTSQAKGRHHALAPAQNRQKHQSQKGLQRMLTPLFSAWVGHLSQNRTNGLHFKTHHAHFYSCHRFRHGSDLQSFFQLRQIALPLRLHHSFCHRIAASSCPKGHRACPTIARPPYVEQSGNCVSSPLPCQNFPFLPFRDILIRLN